MRVRYPDYCRLVLTRGSSTILVVSTAEIVSGAMQEASASSGRRAEKPASTGLPPTGGPGSEFQVEPTPATLCERCRAAGPRYLSQLRAGNETMQPGAELGSDALWLSIRQVARIYQLPASTVAQLCREGRIPGARKFGKHWRVLRAALELEAATILGEENSRAHLPQGSYELEDRHQAERRPQRLDRPRVEEGRRGVRGTAASRVGGGGSRPGSSRRSDLLQLLRYSIPAVR